MVVVSKIYAEDPCHIPGKDMPGHDIRMLKTSSLSTCRAECAKDKR